MTAPISQPSSCVAIGTTAQVSPPPRGSCTSRVRTQSALCRSQFLALSTLLASGGSSRPPMTIRVGFPPVWESTASRTLLPSRASHVVAEAGQLPINASMSRYPEERSAQGRGVDRDAETVAGRGRPAAIDGAWSMARHVLIGPVVEERRMHEGFRGRARGDVADRGGRHVAAPDVLDADRHGELARLVAHPGSTRDAAQPAELHIDRSRLGLVFRAVELVG